MMTMVIIMILMTRMTKISVGTLVQVGKSVQSSMIVKRAAELAPPTG